MYCTIIWWVFFYINWSINEKLKKCYKIQIEIKPHIYILLGLNCIRICYFQNLTIIHVLEVKPNIWAYFIYTFAQVKINVEISFFEIYNEKIHDLLASSKEKGGKKPTVSYFGKLRSVILDNYSQLFWITTVSCFG